MTLEDTVGKVIEEMDVAFTVANEQMVKKLHKYLLSNPYNYVRELISAEINKNPTKIHMKANKRRFELVDDGEGYTLDEIDALFSQVFFSKDSELKKFSGLVSGVISGSNANAEYVLIESVKDGKKVSYKITSDYKFIRSENTNLKKGTRITVKKDYNFLNEPLYNIMGSALEIEKVNYTCQFFDKNIELKINNSPVENKFPSPEENGFQHTTMEKDGSKLRFFREQYSKTGTEKIFALINGLVFEEQHEAKSGSDNDYVIIDNPDFDLNLSRNTLVNFDRKDYTRLGTLVYESLKNDFRSAERTYESLKNSGKETGIYRAKSDLSDAAKELFKIISAEYLSGNQLEKIFADLYEDKILATCDDSFISIKEFVDILNSEKEIYHNSIKNKDYFTNGETVLYDVINDDSIRGSKLNLFVNHLKSYLVEKEAHYPKINILPHKDYLKQYFKDHNHFTSVNSNLKRIKRQKKLDELVGRVKSSWGLITDSSERDFSDYTNLLKASLNLGFQYSILKPYDSVSTSLNFSFHYSAYQLSKAKDKTKETSLEALSGLGKVFAGTGTALMSAVMVGGSIIAAPFLGIAYVGGKILPTKGIKKISSKAGIYWRNGKFSPKAMKRRRRIARNEKQSEVEKEESALIEKLNDLYSDIFIENEDFLKQFPNLKKPVRPAIRVWDPKELGFTTKNYFKKNDFKSPSEALKKVSEDSSEHSLFSIYKSDNEAYVFARNDNPDLQRWAKMLEKGPLYEPMVKIELLNVYLRSHFNHLKWTEYQLPDYMTYKEEMKSDRSEASYANYDRTTIPFTNGAPITENLARLQTEDMRKTKLALIDQMVDMYNMTISSEAAIMKLFENVYSTLRIPDRQVLIKEIQSNTEHSNETIDSFLDKTDSELVDFVCRTMIESDDEKARREEKEKEDVEIKQYQTKYGKRAGLEIYKLKQL